jgi:hypothetical protein
MADDLKFTVVSRDGNACEICEEPCCAYTVRLGNVALTDGYIEGCRTHREQLARRAIEEFGRPLTADDSLAGG